ncbi:hypothetical protein RRG08_032101 [Elysia crispata]|uniref:Uncharacterized protein n=1 Tax=Elysia crispata TaxID=231223 RepID=A0AAE0ZES2_9GAST|nr:hypothetical protein RRG08_032101 [Elysia crispata]
MVVTELIRWLSQSWSDGCHRADQMVVTELIRCHWTMGAINLIENVKRDNRCKVRSILAKPARQHEPTPRAQRSASRNGTVKWSFSFTSPISCAAYYKVFKEKNISLAHLGSDECKECLAHSIHIENGNCSEPCKIYQRQEQHKSRAKQARDSYQTGAFCFVFCVETASKETTQPSTSSSTSSSGSTSANSSPPSARSTSTDAGWTEATQGEATENQFRFLSKRPPGVQPGYLPENCSAVQAFLCLFTVNIIDSLVNSINSYAEIRCQQNNPSRKRSRFASWTPVTRAELYKFFAQLRSSKFSLKTFKEPVLKGLVEMYAQEAGLTNNLLAQPEPGRVLPGRPDPLPLERVSAKQHLIRHTKNDTKCQ